MGLYDEHYQKSCDLRDEFWGKIGEVHPDVLAPMVSQGPRWPSGRQAFKYIKAGDTTIVTSDGLTDPYEDMESNEQNAKYNGFGMEVYIEASEELVPTNSKDKWQFHMLFQMAMQVAHFGNIITQIEKHQYMTTEVYDVPAPDTWRNEEGRVGVLMGLNSKLVPQKCELSLEPVRFINLKLLTLNELNYVIEKGAEGRMELAEAFNALDHGSLSSLDRESLK